MNKGNNKKAESFDASKKSELGAPTGNVGEKRKKILVHICCSSCFSYVAKKLKEENLEVIGYFYNPEVHGKSEYNKRLKDVRDFCNEDEIELIVPKYDVQEYFAPIMPYMDKTSIKYIADKKRWKRKRCQICILKLLEKTAETARDQKINYFTSTMLTSPYKDHDEIWNRGLALEQLFKVNFYYRDFRKGYWAGRNYGRSHNMVIPSYCGCVYSAEEGILE